MLSRIGLAALMESGFDSSTLPGCVRAAAERGDFTEAIRRLSIFIEERTQIDQQPIVRVPRYLTQRSRMCTRSASYRWLKYRCSEYDLTPSRPVIVDNELLACVQRILTPLNLVTSEYTTHTTAYEAKIINQWVIGANTDTQFTLDQSTGIEKWVVGLEPPRIAASLIRMPAEDRQNVIDHLCMRRHVFLILRSVGGVLHPLYTSEHVSAVHTSGWEELIDPVGLIVSYLLLPYEVSYHSAPELLTGYFSIGRDWLPTIREWIRSGKQQLVTAAHADEQSLRALFP